MNNTTNNEGNIEHNNTVSLADDSSCTGCGACGMICPNKAIQMVQNSFGFLEPKIDQNKCNKCGLCAQVCPIISNVDFFAPAQNCYAAINRDWRIRKASSSGGAFSAIAEFFLQNNGLVCGACVDKDLTVKHVIIDKQDDLDCLRGSKYVQSNTTDIFILIKNHLKAGKKVLFSGTPCQVAGLRSYLIKDYPNLYTIDFVCHGVPSPGIFNDYISELISSYPNTDKITFRDKYYGWHSIRLSLWNADKIIYSERLGSDPFLKSFQSNLILRDSCHNCKFSTNSRVSDVTIGDFWCIDQIDPNYKNDNFGISLIIPNSRKGNDLFNLIKPKLSNIKEYKYSDVVKHTSNLRRPSLLSPNREKCLSDYKDFRIKSVNSKENNNRATNLTNILSQNAIPVGILNFHNADNYGAVLVAYSLTNLVNSLGYKAEIINTSRRASDPHFADFRNKFLSLSPKGDGIDFYESMNHRYQKFITGSDQVFRMRNTPTYMFNWVHGMKTLISYSASFGTESFEGSCSKEEASTLLKRFDALSIRESSGVDLCKNEFQVSATQTLDPVLMLDSDKYEQIISQAEEKLDVPDYEYVAVMFFGEARKKVMSQKDIFSDIKAKYPLISINRDSNGKLRSIPQFLSYIKNAKYVITNSFHGTVLSIIFKKKFVSIVNLSPARQSSLLQSVGIDLCHLSNDISTVNLKAIDSEINYEFVYQRLNSLRNDSLVFLKNALAIPPSFKKQQTISQEFNVFMNNSLQTVTKRIDESGMSLIHEDSLLFKKLAYDDKYMILGMEKNASDWPQSLINFFSSVKPNCNLDDSIQNLLGMKKTYSSINSLTPYKELNQIIVLIQNSKFADALSKIRSIKLENWSYKLKLHYYDILFRIYLCTNNNSAIVKSLNKLPLTEEVIYKRLYSSAYSNFNDLNTDTLNNDISNVLHDICVGNKANGIAQAANIIDSINDPYLLLFLTNICISSGSSFTNVFRKKYFSLYSNDFLWSRESASLALNQKRYKHAINHINNAYHNDLSQICKSDKKIFAQAKKCLKEIRAIKAKK